MMELSTFSVCVVIFYFLGLCEPRETCQGINVCSCKFENGSEVNLKPIDGGKTPSFTGIEGADQRKFDWNPCTPFNTAGGCDNTMVCQTSTGGDENAGSKDSTFFSVESGNVVVTYGYQPEKTGSKDYKRRSKIILQCDPKAGNGTIKKFSEDKGSGSSTYTATFTSSYACAKGGEAHTGLSIGSILLIVFFPLVLLYIVAGILINYHGKGVRSMPEMLPNHSFWADFPFLVKDGAVLSYGAVKSTCFSLSRKCKKDSYAEI